MTTKTTKKAKAEKPVKSDTIEVVEILEDTPQELVLIKQEYGLKLADEKVGAHILTYTPYFKQLICLEVKLEALLLKEPTSETAKEATELRKEYRDIRTASEKQKKTDKEEINIEGGFLDKVFKRIEDGAKSKEAKCLEIEKHLEKLEEQKKETLTKERSALLDTVDYGDSSFLPLGDMEQEAFDRLFENARKNKENADFKANADKKEQEERDKVQARTNERIAKIIGVGFALSEDKTKYENGKNFFTIDGIQKETDEKFDKVYSLVKTEFDAAEKIKNDALQAEKDKATKITNRINALAKIGMIFNTSTTYYEGFGQRMSVADLEGMEATDFKDNLDIFTEKINKLKSDQAAKVAADKKKAQETEDENKRLKKEKEDTERAAAEKLAAEKLAAEKAAKAPDLDKYRVIHGEIVALKKKLKETAFTSETGKQVQKDVVDGFNIIIKSSIEYAKKLV